MANNIIDSIQLSGVTYGIKGSGGTETIELTQAQYDALVDKDPNVFYIITDAEAGDLTNYYTKTETNTLLGDKADTATTYNMDEVNFLLANKQAKLVSGTNIKTINNTSILGSGNIDIQGGGVNVVQTTGTSTADVMSQDAVTTAINDLEETLAAKINIKQGILTEGNGITIEEDVISVTGKVDTSTYNTYTAATDTALASKQDTLVSGTNIKTINNESILGSGNIDIQGGGGGGKAVSAGTNISITTGETADTINCTLPMFSGSAVGASKINHGENVASGLYSNAEGSFTKASKDSAHAEGSLTNAFGEYSHAEGYKTTASGNSAHAEGGECVASGERSHAEGYKTTASTYNSHTEGYYTVAYNASEHSNGKYNVSNTGSTTADKTLFSVGNGTADNARHNAFEIRQNGDIYLTLDGQDVKLQDQLGGGGSDINVVQTTGTSTADVMSQDAVTTQLNNKANKTAAVGGYRFGSTNFGSTNNVVYLKYISVSNSDIGTAIYYPKINGKDILTNNSTWAQNNYNFQLVETSAITTSISSSSTDSQVPSAKAVYDALQEGSGGMTEDDELLLSTALTDLNDRKADKSLLGNYQRKGDYVTTNTLNTRLADYETALDEQNVEEVTAYALNDLNNRFGGLSLVKITESEYAALTTKDENTLYIVIADPS